MSSHNLDDGIRAHDKGDLVTAESIYKKVLEKSPRNSDAIYLLGVVDYQRENYERAEERIRKAIRMKPRVPFYYYYLGLIEKHKGDTEAALKCFRKGISIRKDLASFYEELSQLQMDMREFKDAAVAARKYIKLKPEEALGYNLHGMALHGLGRIDDSIEQLNKALELREDYPEAHNNLGNCYHTKAQWLAAEKQYQRAVQLEEKFPQAWSNLGDCYRRQGKLNLAMSALNRAISLDPEHGPAYLNIGSVQHYRGELKEAEASYLKGLGYDPDNDSLYSNYLFSLNYRDDISALEIFEKHRSWAAKFDDNACARKNARSHSKLQRTRTLESGKIRIAFLSRDFKWHSVSFFLESVYRNIDRNKFEVVSYADVAESDVRTGIFRPLSDKWVSIVEHTDDALEEQIKRDKIDILIDLGGHTEHNKLPVLARKAAPVQISWLGYPHSTGLSQVDYRLVDAITEPLETAQAVSSEKIHHLPDGFHCFTPPPDYPDVSPAPSLEKGHVTFGSFNHLPKITRKAVHVWAEILKRVPDSRLVLKSLSLEEPAIRQRFRGFFLEEGIAAGRVEFLSWRGKVEEHLGAYGMLDIALDTFPYNGTTTTCESLWMGVPVVGLLGDRHAGRVGASLLEQVDLGSLVASSEEEYIEIAANLAGESNRLEKLRSLLRQKMADSTLMDQVRFTRNLENALQAMWQAFLSDKEV